MGSTSFLKPRSSVYRTKSGSSAGSDKEMNAKLKRTKIRRPAKMSDYGMKRIPDYTEMAYKEAVSKLKYFLSGNNPPSVRSYGSIKNLDESDGDLDKKYSSSYNSEFKARPRLTAKYSTLYADSLANYNPPPINTTNVSQDVSGATNPDVVNFIQKQEEYIEQLERESQYCRDELNNLLGKVKEVITENEHLHEAQKNKIISRMFHSYNGSETDDLEDVDSTGLDSDCKISPSKTRKSKSRGPKLEGPNIVFESRISELEAQLTQAKIDLKKMQDENNEYKRKVANGLVDSTCLDGFKRQIDNLQRDKTNLESQISKLKLNLDQKEDDFDSKYKKGSDIIEQQLREERKNLENEIRRLQEELSSERARNRSLAGEGARRAVAESAAEQRYRQLADQLQRDLVGRDDCVAKLQMDLERQRRDENDLKREISMKNSAVEELRMELKNKIASLQADLSQSHAEKAALDEELACSRLAIERQQRQAKHETNRLNSEIQSLRQRLDRADADLVHSRRENLRLSEQISNLEKELNMRNLTPISPEKKGKDKELSTMLESMENKHAKTVAELETMIQSQNILMEKLTSECRSLTDKLDDSNRRHKEELATLQRQVANLGRSMKTPHPPSNYEAPSPHPPNATRISNRPTDVEYRHTGSESTGHTTLGYNNDNNGNIDSNQHTNVDQEQTTSSDFQRTLDSKTLPEETETKLIKQHSRELLDNQVPQITKDIVQEDIEKDNEDNLKEIHKGYEEEKPNESHDTEEKEYSKTETSEQPEEYDPNSKQEYPNFEENYGEQYSEQQEYSEQPAYSEQQYTDNAEYPTQEYSEQQGYTGQYENYEQYPQQYTDPNTQYEGQEGFESYATEGNYSEQNYENQPINEAVAPQYPDAVEPSVSQESEMNNEQLTNQS